MSDEPGNVYPIEIKLRSIDRKRLDSLQERTETALSSELVASFANFPNTL
jgi:hypothetical protein